MAVRHVSRISPLLHTCGKLTLGIFVSSLTFCSNCPWAQSPQQAVSLPLFTFSFGKSADLTSGAELLLQYFAKSTQPSTFFFTLCFSSRCLWFTNSAFQGSTDPGCFLQHNSTQDLLPKRQYVMFVSPAPLDY